MSASVKKPHYYLKSTGEFVIENYNFAKPFANFFPGIAGKYGIPMWVFYVNRGQAIISMGTRDKDHSLLEFFSANKAWQFATLLGFRTFIKVKTGAQEAFYEPFHNGFANMEFAVRNTMAITSHDLKLEEENSTLGLKTTVTYFTIPNDSYAALARIVTIKNTSRATRRLQLLDGLPQLVPYGTSNLFLKKLGRTIEAWMHVENLKRGVAFYKLDVDPTDRPEVTHIAEGNFYLAFRHNKNKTEIIKPIVDPATIFGEVTDFTIPYRFVMDTNFTSPLKEITASKTPAAFMFRQFSLKPQEEQTLFSLSGQMRSLEMLNSTVPEIIKPGYLQRKKEENKVLIEELQKDIETKSSCQEFDLYAKQTYLDNIVRGGYPTLFKSGSIFYLYSRKHGDLERDYNKFQIQPAYFSQGNGNYRDTNQNRRSDTWFNPEIKEKNLIFFLNLIQTDGFNPLVVKGAHFTLINTEGCNAELKKMVREQDIPKLHAFLQKPFTPGEVILFIEEQKIKLLPSYDSFLDALLCCCRESQEAEHGEGFWTDHWTYNLDLIESYLGVYPENLTEIVFEKRIFTFYDSPETVKPRSEKYVLVQDKVKQLHALMPDSAKKEMIRKRKQQAHVVRQNFGKGEIYETSLINKLLCLLANKLSSLDPFGIGIEMEADKPNWYDALNGLPALFGSSVNETFELKRLIIFLKDALKKTGVENISVIEEVCDFLKSLDALIQEYYRNNASEKEYRFWDESHTLKEEYRRKTRFGLGGKECKKDAHWLGDILDNALRKVESGINKAKDTKQDLYYSYFMHEVISYEPLTASFVKPTKFVQKKLPLFLEGQMHALRLAEDGKEAKSLYEATKASPLFDKTLKMYKVTAALNEMPEEIGRCRVFTPGWLERESIWLHMEYKYLLELLKKGLTAEFYQDFKNALIPFQKAERYGRSILENCSFLVSSVFPDKNLHGNGYVARLSGSTAEFLQMWLIMNTGVRPFRLNNKDELTLTFSPILAGWLFTQEEKTYGFNLLGKVWVTYHNPKRLDTFGKKAATPAKITFNDKDGNPVEISGDTIPAPYAEQVRLRQIPRIHVFLRDTQ